MNDFFWYLFEKSGNINFYLAYKKYGEAGAANYEFGEDTGDNNS